MVSKENVFEGNHRAFDSLVYLGDFALNFTQILPVRFAFCESDQLMTVKEQQLMTKQVNDCQTVISLFIESSCLRQEICMRGPQFKGKVFNATDITYEMFDETMKMNTYGVWNTVSALVPHMKEKGGCIASVSSITGFLGVFGYSDYTASKFAVTGLSEALRSELKPFGITVSVLCPPDTQTPGFDVENLTKPEETKVLSESAKVMTSDAVAKGFIKGIKKGKFMIIPGFDGKLTYLAKRLVPGIVEMVMNSTVRKVQKRMK